MPKMTRADLRAMLSAQKAAAMAATRSSKLTKDRDDAQMYYLGDMSQDLPAEDGRSQAVSTDVADTIEGLMPQLMEVFAGSEEVVEFNPVGPEDVEPARQETDYVNHVFMSKNPGFMILYSFIKDALLSKNGVVKCWWEESEEEENETYYDLTDDQFNIIASDDEVEIIEHSAKPIEDPQLALQAQTQAYHDVKVSKRKTYGCAKALGVPPEEFGIEANARSIKTSNYCFHKVIRPHGELVAQGFDKKQLETLGTYSALTSTEEKNRSSVDEDQMGTEDSNPAARMIEITEHYVRMDYEGDGKTCLYRVTTGGEDGVILKRNGEDDIIKFDEMPFASMTPIPVTHRFFGRSIADIVKDIQRIKSALLRAMLDNAYLANNARTVVSESHVSDNTLDDLLVSRPGGLVRVKMPGGIEPLPVQTIGNHVYPLLEYMDVQREMRTGVTRHGQGIDAQALQDQSATAVSQLFTMAQARMRLIAKIFAETGVKDLFILLHGIIRKHGSQQETYRLRNQWVTVDPRDWKKRADMTVHVGLGHGSKAEKIAVMNMIASYQEKALTAGLTNLVDVNNLYNTAKELTRLAGKPDVDSYFTDPSTQPEPPPRVDPKIMELQAKNEIEKTQAQADIATQQVKTNAEIALAEKKFQLEERLAIEESARKEREHQMKLMEIAAKYATQPKKTDENGNVIDNGPDMSVLHAIMAHATPPRSKGMKIVRDERGRVSHAVPIE